MYPVPIKQYFRPRSVEEARQIAADANGEFFFVAGGMSLMQAMKSRMIAPDCLIDLNFVDELRGIQVAGKQIRIGAMTRYRNVVEEKKKLGPFTALSDAAAHVGDRQVRNRGTLGGSLAWNYISACTPVASLACGATNQPSRPASTDYLPQSVAPFEYYESCMRRGRDHEDSARLRAAEYCQRPDD